MDALAEHGEGSFGKEEDTFGAGAKGIDDQLAAVIFGEEDGSDAGIRHAQPAQQA